MWNTRSCICDWFIRSLFSDHPHYLSCILLLEHRYGWTHIYYFFFFLFFLYSTFYLFFFFPKWLSAVVAVVSYVIVSSQDVNRQRFIPIFFRYPCFQQKLTLIFHLRRSILKLIATMSHV